MPGSVSIGEGLGLSSSTAIAPALAVTLCPLQLSIAKVRWQRSLPQIPCLKLSGINLPSIVIDAF